MKIKTLLLITILACCLYSCSDSFGTNYTYKWKVSVTYTNGDTDTLICDMDSFKGNACYLNLKIIESGLLSGGGTTPSLMAGCGFRQKVIVCGIRKYEILSLNKILLE